MCHTFSKIINIFPPTACGSPPVIENGHVANAETNIVSGNSVDYKCNSGYFADGANSDKLQTLCEANGRYTLNTENLASCTIC